MMTPMLLAAALATTGIVDNPCPAPVGLPAEFAAWRAKLYLPGNHDVLPPPAAASAYQVAYLEARKSDWADLCHYRADNARLVGLPQGRHDIVFIGDSITEGWGYANPSFFRAGRINRGISGQTTPQMLVRFPADVLALHPRIVHIMAGTNDVAGNTGPTTLDTIEDNIAAMITLAKHAGIGVVLAAVPPTAKFPWRPDLQPARAIATLNQRLRALARRERITFVDYGTAIEASDGAMRREMSLDGVHPNTAGYAAMEPLTLRALSAIRQRH